MTCPTVTTTKENKVIDETNFFNETLFGQPSL